MLRSLYTFWIRFFYYIDYTRLEKLNIKVIVACYNGNIDTVLPRLFFAQFIYFLSLLFFINLLIKRLLIRQLTVLSKISILLTILAFIIARYLFSTGVLPSRYYCKVFYHFNNLFANEFSFYGG